MTTRQQRKRTRYVEHVGFYHGSQGVSPEHELAHLEGQTREDEEQIRHGAVDEVSDLDAAEAVLARRHAEASRVWDALREETSGRAPNVWIPRTVGLAGFAALIGEVLFLAPMMDGLGIASRFGQLLLASTVVFTAAILVHMSDHGLFRQPADSAGRFSSSWPDGQRGRLASLCVGLLTFGVLWTLGRWRALQMMFVADGTLAEFLQLNVGLMVTFVTLLTVALPLVSAVALDWATRASHYGWLWTQSQRTLSGLHRQLEQTRKRRAAVIDKRDHELELARQHGVILQCLYLEHHELGRHLGADRAPLYLFVLRAAVLGMALGAGAVAVEAVVGWGVWSGVRLTFYALFVLALTGAYAARLWRVHTCPSPRELFQWRRVRWQTEKRSPRTERVSGSPSSRISLHEALSSLQHADVPAEEGAGS